VRAGMEEWLRRGPNKRMTPNRRAKCLTRHPDHRLSTVHENGASPKIGYDGAKRGVYDGEFIAPCKC
jgi:hypothetical protein